MLYALTFIVIAVMWILISKIIWRSKITLPEMGVQAAASILITGIALSVGYFSNIHDVQTINGQVTEKVKEKDSYVESYSCNCRTVSSGSGKDRVTSTVCDTCYRDVYTIEWYLKTTIGDIVIERNSSYSRSIWNKQDPSIYSNAYIGEPCAKKDSFVNYIKASKGSLFNSSKMIVHLDAVVPSYPQIFNEYQINSVMSMVPGLDVSQYNILLRDKLKTLSAKKQINIIVLFTPTKDPMYLHKVEAQWLGGKKNDFVVVIAVDGDSIIWADGFTFGLSQGNHLLISQVKDALVGKKLDPAFVISTITHNAENMYVRKSMKDFEYLVAEIKPSDGLLYFLIVLQLVLNVGLTIFNIKTHHFG